MFQKILLPVDLTEKHAAALDVAGRLAQQTDGAVTLLHVVEVINGLPPEEEGTFYSRLERVARSHLQQLGNGLEERKVPYKIEVRLGKRAADTVRFAAETAADLIVVTAPPVDPANPAVGLHSMSYTIGLFAKCPVLVVK
ncbi:MAG TPA: universal stress protein [Gemmataceae bacterium]|nr:universal stress protein [Gemmataceae bacterium]